MISHHSVSNHPCTSRDTEGFATAALPWPLMPAKCEGHKSIDRTRRTACTPQNTVLMCCIARLS